MKLASYNIRKAVGLDWWRDPKRIVDVLAEIDADVVVLQEADKRMGRRAGVLSEDLLVDHGYRIAEVAIRPESHGWHGNVILHKTNFPPYDNGRIDIPALEPRGAVRAMFEGVEVVGAHLALTKGTRRRQFKVLAEHAAKTPEPLIIAGDFNEWGKGHFTGGGQLIIPGHSFHAARPVASLDRFIVFGALEVVNSYVHRSALAAKASDHLPVVLEFSP